MKFRRNTPPDPQSSTSPPGARATEVMGGFGALVLFIVGAIGAVTSFGGQRAAAEEHLGKLAATFPVTVDGLILGATLRYVAGVRQGRAQPGYRIVAHAGIIATVFFNALSANTSAGVPWHVWAPLSWGILMELAGREAMGHYVATTDQPVNKISKILWLVSPAQTAIVWVYLKRVPDASVDSARTHVAVLDAARRSLQMSLRGRGARRTRRVIMRHVQAGVLRPDAVLAATENQAQANDVLRAVIAEVLVGRAAKQLGQNAGGTKQKKERRDEGPSESLVLDKWWSEEGRDETYRDWVASLETTPLSGTQVAERLGMKSGGTGRNVINQRFRPRYEAEGNDYPAPTEDPENDDETVVVDMRDRISG